MTWEHGTLAGYNTCGGGGRHACDDCRRANRERSAALRRRKAYGRTVATDRRDPTRSIQALSWLAAMGHNTIAIQQLTGIPNTIVGRLLRDQASYVYLDTEQRALAGLHYALTHPTWQMRSRHVPSARAWQQMRSLTALGWPMHYLTTQLGYERDLPNWDRPLMLRTTADRVQALYDRLSGTRGPSDRAAAHARRLGWHVPLAYDDDGRLIQEAIPNALSEARERREDRESRAARVAELTARGLTTQQIAEQLGVADRTVTRTRARRDLAS